MTEDDIKKFRAGLKKTKVASALVESIDDKLGSRGGWKRSKFFANVHKAYLKSLDENGNVRGE